MPRVDRLKHRGSRFLLDDIADAVPDFGLTVRLFSLVVGQEAKVVGKGQIVRVRDTEQVEIEPLLRKGIWV